MKPIVTLCLFAVWVTMAGCSNKEKIVLVPIEGKLLIEGKPVPLARVEFMPEFKGHGAEANSEAITDETGKFVLAMGVEPGVAIGTHRVVVNEAPAPGNTRGQDEASQTRLGEYSRGLKNRPLPFAYQTYSSTPLKIEVTAEKRDLVIELRR